MNISIYKGSTDTQGVTADHIAVLQAIKDGRWQEPITLLRELLQSDKVDEYGEQKKNLTSVIFSGTFSERNDSSLTAYSGLICLDVDGLSLEQVKEYKEAFVEDKFIYACFTSPSAAGLKIIIKIPNNPENHLSAFLSLESYFKNNYAIALDKSGKNLSRLCYVSYDPELIFNENAEEYTFDAKEVQKTIVTTNSFDARPERFKDYVVSTDARYVFKVCEKWTEKNYKYEEGSRNNYIHVLACNLNRAGVFLDDSILLCYNAYSDLPFKELEKAIKSSYRKKSEHNTIDVYKEKDLPTHTDKMSMEEETIFNDTLLFLRQGVKLNTISKYVKLYALKAYNMAEGDAIDIMGEAYNLYREISAVDLLKHESVDDSILNVLEYYTDSKGVPTTIREIDEDLQGGLMPGCLYGFIGKGKTFKSIFAHWIGAENANNGGLTLYLNGEMSFLQLLDRVANKELGIHLLKDLRSKAINEETLPIIAQQLKDKLKGNFEVVNSTGWTKDSIVKTVAEIEDKSGKKVSLIVVDGLSQCENIMKEEIKSAIHNSGMLKEVAKESNSAVIALMHTSGGIASHIRDTSKFSRGGDKIIANMDGMFCTSLLVDEQASDIDNGDIMYKKGIFYLRYIDKRTTGNVISKIIEVSHPMNLKALDVDPFMMEVKIG